MWAKIGSSSGKNEKEQTTDKKDGAKSKSKKEDISDLLDDLITLNVGGIKHQTQISTLMKLKNTRLTYVADKAKSSGQREFFFDRHPDLFPYILNFYRSGKLHMPTNICGPLIKEELNYWKIDDKDIQQCCWVHYINHEETFDMIERFEKDEHHHKVATEAVSEKASFFQKQRPKIWRGLQEPSTSTPAKVLATASLTVVILSIVIFIIETLPYFDSIAVRHHGNITNADIREEFNIFNMGNRNEYHILLILDHGCNLFFFCEFILKLISSPNKLKFMKIPMTIVELLCLIPYYLAVMIVYIHPDPKNIFFVIRILFATRLLRIFRIFVLMKHNLALKVLVYTIKASTRELLLLLLVVVIGVIIFASLEFYMEVFGNAEDVEINHIPMALWWALITMTTVGYGDFVPKSGPGYAVGAICATSGVLVIALSVPAIVNNFTLYYLHAKCRLKLRQRKRKFHLNIWQKLTDNALKGKPGGESEKPLLARVAELAKKEKLSKSSVAPMKPHDDVTDGKTPSSSEENKTGTKEEDRVSNNNNEILVEENDKKSKDVKTNVMGLQKEGDSESKLESPSSSNKTLPELKRSNLTNGLLLGIKESQSSNLKEPDDSRESRSSTVADDNTMDLKSIN